MTLLTKAMLGLARHAWPGSLRRSFFRKFSRRQKGQSFDTLTEDGFDMHVTCGDSVANQLVVNRLFEIELTERFRALAGSIGTFLDIGCNIGYFSCLVAKLNTGVRILSIDANPEMCRQCRANLDQNGFNSAQVVHSGVGAERGELILRHRKGNPSRGSFGEEKNGAEMEEHRVPIAPLPELLAAHGMTQVDVMKIDVEGFEGEVFRALDESHVAGMRHIFFELSQEHLQRCGSSREKLSETPWLSLFTIHAVDGGPHAGSQYAALKDVPDEVTTVWLKSRQHA
jgi:FkbM family methyltransferase